MDLVLGGNLQYPEARGSMRRRCCWADTSTLRASCTDLKLVDENGDVKISDLGLALLLGESNKVRGYAGTPGYTAPALVLGFKLRDDLPVPAAAAGEHAVVVGCGS